MEKYITFSAGKIHSIESLKFMTSSPEKLVEFSIPAAAKNKNGNILPEKIGLADRVFPISARHSRGTSLLQKKLIYP